MRRSSVTEGRDGREPLDHNQTSVKLAAGAAFGQSAFTQWAEFEPAGPPSIALFAPKADAEAFKDCGRGLSDSASTLSSPLIIRPSTSSYARERQGLAQLTAAYGITSFRFVKLDLRYTGADDILDLPSYHILNPFHERNYGLDRAIRDPTPQTSYITTRTDVPGRRRQLAHHDHLCPYPMPRLRIEPLTLPHHLLQSHSI